MEHKVSPTRIILTILLVNAIGFALKYFELDTFVLILGFRFHLSAVLPFLAVINKEYISLIKPAFLEPKFTKVGKVIFTILFVTITFLVVLFLTKKIEIGDPEYFYEFGLSSLVDFPIYLVWNSFQLILLYLFFLIIQKSIKYNFLIFLLVSILILAYEFIPLKKIILDYTSITALVLMCLIIALIFKFFNNIYLIVIIVFSIIWFSILTFGSSSSTLINIFFAAKYDSWEGFVAAEKTISQNAIPVYYLLILLSLFILSFIGRGKSIN